MKELQMTLFFWAYDSINSSTNLLQKKLFKQGSNEPVQAGLASGNTQSNVRHETSSQANAERDAGAALSGSPFKREMNLSQQIEVAKLSAYNASQEIKKVDWKFQFRFQMIENLIATRTRMIKQLKITDQEHDLWTGLNKLLQQQSELMSQYTSERECTCQLSDNYGSAPTLPY